MILGIAIAFGAGASAALAQGSPKASQPVRNVTKTLLGSEAQKECFPLNNQQRLYYRFNADGPLDFKLSHQEDKEVIDVRHTRTVNEAGSFSPSKSADHCLVWSNTGSKAVTLSYEFQRNPK
ncbi:MAG: hypothetical protein WA373_13315 [Burkholderiales bacterium]